MNRIKIAFVLPPVSTSENDMARVTQPLGVASIGTYLKEQLGDKVQVDFYDGFLDDLEIIKSGIQAGKYDFVGISPTIASYSPMTLDIATVAKESGSYVVLGGVYATNLWQNILVNQPNIDAVVLFDGEIPFGELIERQSPRGVSNLCYKDEEKIVPAERVLIPEIGRLPVHIHDVLPMEKYFTKQYSSGRSGVKAVSYYGGKGCMKRGRGNPRGDYSLGEYSNLVNDMSLCSFCGRNELGFRLRDVETEDAMVKHLFQDYGVQFFFNVQDTVVLDERPAMQDVPLDEICFRHFCSLESLNERNINLLKIRYGHNIILQVGIESPIGEMRINFGKPPFDEREIRDKLELLRRHGLQMHATYILGGPGESKDSLDLSVKSIKETVTDFQDVITWIGVSPELILPGSPDAKRFLSVPELGRTFSQADVYDIQEMNDLFLKHFSSGLRRRDILDAIREIFGTLRKSAPNTCLDGKGLRIPDEVDYVHPYRPWEEGYLCYTDFLKKRK